eukprot:TRINITY_DN22115_c0_g1_i1.p2 TRINITY_DN22115_c0_g1~~TRINITY_DN22115_c0_g1_i1.p2  ORF type:complete len:183 (+),score=93.02 TRINITY_DN22115_c0_g1_i1:56-550(+)
MSTKEVNDLLVEYSKQMCVRRQELLEAIKKRSAASIAGEELPPPKRIALSQIKLESLNVIRPRAKKADAHKDPVVQKPVAAAPAPQHTQPETPEMPPPNSPEDASPVPQVPVFKAPELVNGGKWWDSANVAAQLERQSELSPSAVFEPRLSPINATEIFRHLKK